MSSSDHSRSILSIIPPGGYTFLRKGQTSGRRLCRGRAMAHPRLSADPRCQWYRGLHVGLPCHGRQEPGAGGVRGTTPPERVGTRRTAVVVAMFVRTVRFDTVRFRTRPRGRGNDKTLHWVLLHSLHGCSTAAASSFSSVLATGRGRRRSCCVHGDPYMRACGTWPRSLSERRSRN